MYLDFFELKKDPFQMTPDPAFMFLSPGHQKALAAINNGVGKKKGVVLVVGAVGVGKTTVLRVYLEKMKEEKVKAICILNPSVQFDALLRCVLRELGVAVTSDDISEMTERLRLAVMEEGQKGGRVLLVVDEAQNLPMDTLEKLCTLAASGEPFENRMQIVFSAQPEFENTLDLLNNPKDIGQRIAAKTAIRPLSREESTAYIRHRLETAAGKKIQIFSDSALREIVRHASGIPRTINVICDNCLFRAFSYGKKPVSLEIAREITCEFGRARPFPVLKAAAGFALAASLLCGAYLGLAKAAQNKPVAAAVARYGGMATAYLHDLAQKGDSLTRSFIIGCDREADRAVTFVRRMTSRIPPP